MNKIQESDNLAFAVFLITLPIALPAWYFIRSDRGFDFVGRFPYQPRILHWLIACWGGLFWLPCPMCGKHFGGHEWGESIHSDWFSGRGVCPKCADKAREHNKALFKRLREI